MFSQVTLADPQQALQLIDYIAVDYGHAVENGQIINKTEYAEMLDFTAGISQQLNGLPETDAKGELIKQGKELTQGVEQKEPITKLRQLISTMRHKIIASYNVAVSPRTQPNLAQASLLYAKQCASCHGENGSGDGVASLGMDQPPINFNDSERYKQRTLYGLYNTISKGVNGTAMTAFNQLSEQQRWALAFYVGSFAAKKLAIDKDSLFKSLPLMNIDKLTTITPAQAEESFGKQGAIVMATLRNNIRTGASIDVIKQDVRSINQKIGSASELLGTKSLSAKVTFTSAFFILLREGLEALLIVAALVAFLVRTNRRDGLCYIHFGWIGALILGGLTWWASLSLIDISGVSREATEGIAGIVATVILLYVGFWMHDKTSARKWKKFIDDNMNKALNSETLWTLSGLSFIAVYREAFETILFYQAIWVQAGDTGQHMVLIGFISAASIWH